jgi:hypothetical protein
MFTVTVIAAYAGLAPLDWQPALREPSARGLMAAGLALVVIGGLVTVVRRLLRIAAALRKPGP